MAEGEAPELSVEGLHLEHADPKEHIGERGGLDRYEGAARFARHRLGHQRLAGSRGSPEQDPSGDVPTLRLDGFRVLQVDDVLLDPLENLVLSLDVLVPRVDVVGHVRLDSSAREEPEDRRELTDGNGEDEHDLGDQRQGFEDGDRQPEDRAPDRCVVGLSKDEVEEEQREQPLECPGDSMAIPGVEAGCPPLESAEDPLRPEAVIAGPPLADPIVDLPTQFQSRQQDDPPERTQSEPEGIRERLDWLVLRPIGPNEQGEGDQQEEQDLGSVPQGQGLPCRSVLVPRPTLRCRRGRGFVALLANWSRAVGTHLRTPSRSMNPGPG